MRLFSLVLFVCSLSFGVAKVGEKAPAFSLKDSDGKIQKLADYKGKIVVLEWFNPGCPFVKKHYESSNIPNLQKAYTQKEVVWFQISSSAKGKEGFLNDEEVKKEKAKSHATGLLRDTDGKIGKAYGAKTTPHFFIIDKEGNVSYAGAIDDKATADAEDIKTSKNYVQAALDELLNGKKVATASTIPYGCSVKY